jgi:hypothetical protein
MCFSQIIIFLEGWQLLDFSIEHHVYGAHVLFEDISKVS